MTVPTAVTPTGVEHYPFLLAAKEFPVVPTAVTPTGVEHLTGPTPVSYTVTCRPQ